MVHPHGYRRTLPGSIGASPGQTQAMTVLATLAADPDASILNYQHLQVLSVICSRPAPPTAGEIAAAMKIDRMLAWRRIDLLAERGFLTRRRRDDDPDRRSVYFEPTAAGRALDQRVRSALSAIAA